MKLRIKAKGFRLRLRLPTSLLKSKFIIKQIIKNNNLDIGIDTKDVCKILSHCFSILKDYKGMTIIDIEAQDGTIIKITL